MIPLAWLVLGVILLAVELHHLAFYSLFAAVGCFAAAVVAVFVPDAIPLQLAVAVGVSALGIVAIRPMMSRRFHVRTGAGALGKGVAGTLVGEEVLTLDDGRRHPPRRSRAPGRRALVGHQRLRRNHPERHQGARHGGARARRSSCGRSTRPPSDMPTNPNDAPDRTQKEQP